MQLEHIKEEKCLVCGSEVVAEQRRNLHTNGLYNEFRTFKCGKVLHFSPNFERVVTTFDCPNTLEETKKREKREKAKLVLYKFIEKLDIDDDFRQELLDHFRFI